MRPPLCRYPLPAPLGLGWMDGRKEGRMDRRTDGRTDGWTDGQTNGRTDGRLDQWTDGPLDGHMDGQTLIYRSVDASKKSQLLLFSSTSFPLSLNELRHYATQRKSPRLRLCTV